MSFSSAQWTIPELCVWIVTGKKAALNALVEGTRNSLKYADMIHPGARSARDVVIEAAQAGQIIITCAAKRDRHYLEPSRVTLCTHPVKAAA